MSMRNQESLPEWAWATGAADWLEYEYLVWGYSQERGAWYLVNSGDDLEYAKAEADELLAQWDDVVRVSVEQREPFKEVHVRPKNRAANPASASGLVGRLKF